MSRAGAAQYEFEEVIMDGPAPPGAPQHASTLKLEAAARLAEHRARRDRTRTPELFPAPVQIDPSPDSRSGRIAAAVAERYAQAQTYRAFLAAEAERAVQQAKAAAEIAARNAAAVAAAQQQLLSELDDWMPEAPGQPADTAPPPPAPTAAITVRLYARTAAPDHSLAVANAVPHEQPEEEERMALEEEIAFRQSPVFDDFSHTPVPLTANLIEFPRQLVAARKVRPRLAEGPLRDEADARADAASLQLRIFEVEPNLISTAVEPHSSAPEWTSILLSALAAPEPLPANTSPYGTSFPPAPMTARISLRLMAVLVDGCILSVSLLAFVALAAKVAGHVPTGQTALLAAAPAFAILSVFYFLLFFTFADATPGMRYARVGFCTLSDDNPSRAAIRRRLFATLLAASPLGLGLLWALVDEDGLGWHDRLSRMYPRSY